MANVDMTNNLLRMARLFEKKLSKIAKDSLDDSPESQDGEEEEGPVEFSIADFNEDMDTVAQVATSNKLPEDTPPEHAMSQMLFAIYNIVDASSYALESFDIDMYDYLSEVARQLYQRSQEYKTMTIQAGVRRKHLKRS